ncbi:hypothetical protein [Lachnoclostridium phytofermentans]|nr:hypothetical protein [Lachnoclostridium phytofermentans]
MLQLHKIAVLVLTTFFLISGIFAPYGSSYPFFTTTNPYMTNTDLSKEHNKLKSLDDSNEFKKSKNINSNLQNNEICFENDLSQNKLLDFGTSLLPCPEIYIITNLDCKLRINQKLIGIPSLSLDMISYIHKMDGKKDRLATL